MIGAWVKASCCIFNVTLVFLRKIPVQAFVLLKLVHAGARLETYKENKIVYRLNSPGWVPRISSFQGRVQLTILAKLRLMQAVNL